MSFAFTDKLASAILNIDYKTCIEAVQCQSCNKITNVKIIKVNKNPILATGQCTVCSCGKELFKR